MTFGSRMLRLFRPRHKTDDTCGESTIAVGVVFRCYRPRDEPHLTHMGFASSPKDPNKSYTFSWEHGNKKSHLDVYPRTGVDDHDVRDAQREEEDERYHR
jgi:hypothetical protein